jgi:HAMP domain-containing protein
MRTKIIAGNLLTILVVGLASYAMVKANVESAFAAEVDDRINSDFRVLSRSIALNGRELVGLVESQAGGRPLQDVFGALDEGGRRQRAFEASQRVSTWLGDPARERGGRPDITAVLDDTGRVVARDSDVNAMFGVDLGAQIPAIAEALRGNASLGVWESSQDNKALQVAVAPIRGDAGRILGALLVGYDLSNGLARSEGALISRDVGFVWGERVYSSSLDGGAPAELQTELFGSQAAATTAARDQGAVSAPFLVSLAGQDHIAVVGPLPSSTVHVAMVVLANRTAQLDKASSVSLILLLTALGAVIIAAYGFFMGSSILAPIAQIEEGVLQVMNGRTDHRLDVRSPDFGGLAYRINQLLNVLTKTEEVDESGAVAGGGGGWDQARDGSSIAADPSAASPAAGGGEDTDVDPEVAARLASEPEDVYYTRVYSEYVAAKQAVGENVSNIPQDKFVQRLRANEQGLVKKHGCRMVRFEVQTRGTQVNLKPVIIR